MPLAISGLCKPSPEQSLGVRRRSAGTAKVIAAIRTQPHLQGQHTAALPSNAGSLRADFETDRSCANGFVGNAARIKTALCDGARTAESVGMVSNA